MNYEFAEAETLQDEGNSILYFRSEAEREKEKKLINEGVIKDGEFEHLLDKYSSFNESIGRSSYRTSAQKIKDTDIDVIADKDFLGLRELDTSIIRQSKQEIIDNALKVVCEQLNAQTAAIFLFSKDGFLERAGIRGFDKDTRVINGNNWFPEEKYELGESFTGRAALPKEDSSYGEIQFTESLEQEGLKIKNKEKYIEKLGPLRCAIAIPLNGRNKTYGVLRVVNKVSKSITTDSISLSSESFLKDDVALLLILATHIANVLSNFRRDVQSEIFKYLSRLLIQPSNSINNSLDDLYKKVLDLLVCNPENPVKAGVLRSRDERAETLNVEAVSLVESIVGTRDNEPRKLADDQLLLLVINEHKPLILKGIQAEEHIDKFKNKDWIRKNNLQAFVCFPLVDKNEVVGTLSLYAGDDYVFHPNIIDFFQGIADSLASFMLKIRSENREHNLQKNLKVDPREVSTLSSYNSELETEFYHLVAQWKDETKTIPFINQKSVHPAYQKIIGLGPVAIPMILRELNKDADHWFWALQALTRTNPVSPEDRGNMQKMRVAWLNWGRSKGYVFD